MSSKKLNWVLWVGFAALGGMGACGGRTSGWEEQAAVPGAGGASSRGGANSRAGTGQGGSRPLGGGNAQGGKVGMGGSFAVGGSPTSCQPGTSRCDESGQVALQCGPDGQSVSRLDCGGQGLFCMAGQCLSLACEPSAFFCEKNVVLQCSADGSGFELREECPDGTYCEPGARACLCAPDRADCDANLKNGCEVNTTTDQNNCGACGKGCPNGLGCSGGKCSPLYTFSGVALDLPIAKLTGWSQCFAGRYADSVPISKVLASCTQGRLMLACRQAGSSTLQVAAYAPRADVLFDTGPGNSVHNANGVAWYFSEEASWGFAPLGAIVSRSSCDVQASSSESRLCWHSAAGGLEGGWRCGADIELNSSSAFERLLFQAP